MKTNHPLKSTAVLFRMMLLSLTLLLLSCSVQDSMKRKGLVQLHKKMAGNFQNTIMVEPDREVRLSQFFKLNEKDSIVQINSVKNKLVVTFIDWLGAKHHKVFEGKFKKKYFQFHLEYETVLVPPLGVTINEDRVRLSLDENGNLVVNNYYDRSGMILFFGAGGSGNSKYVFNKIQ